MEDPLKKIAAEFVRQLQSGNTRELTQFKQSLDALNATASADLSPAPPAFAGTDDERPVPIKDGWVGIWEPVRRNGQAAFIRSAEHADEWALWAKQHAIPPKGDARRIVLLGESVARGFLYDPMYTPAKSLSTILQSSSLPWKTEVIDLARTSLQANDLIKLLYASIHLSPDAILLFAGNNWREDSRPASPGDRRAAAVILRQNGVAGLSHHLEEKLERRVESYADRFEAFVRETRIPVVFLIPEFNLEDWYPEDPHLVPWFRDGQHQDWVAHMQAASQALEAGDLVQAEANAVSAMTIDQGTAMGSAHILADCRRRQGRHDEVRHLLEQVRDAHLWDAATQSPRSLSVANRVLSRMAERQVVHGVDLPRVFATYLKGHLPNRRIFFDYCHYNSEGIRVAMAAAAETLLPLIGGPQIPLSALAPLDAGPPGPVEAEACFAAAIHNAHWGQPIRLIGYYCRQALEKSEHMGGLMKLYVEMQARQAPLWLCRQTEQIGSLCTEALTRYVLLYAMTAASQKLFDRKLLDAIAETLETAGIPIKESLSVLRVEEHGISRKQRHVNLLDSPYAPSWSHPDWYLFHHWKSPIKRHYYRAHTPESRFDFVANTDVPLMLTITLRGVGISRTEKGECAIEINGKGLAIVAVSAAWQTYRLNVPSEALQKELNVVIVRWSLESDRGSDRLDAAAACLESSHYPSLLKVYGEIHALTMTAVI